MVVHPRPTFSVWGRATGRHMEIDMRTHPTPNHDRTPTDHQVRRGHMHRPGVVTRAAILAGLTLVLILHAAGVRANASWNPPVMDDATVRSPSTHSTGLVEDEPGAK
ncbi:hypothetical protein GCM10025762_44520 [Haloechinothrix salitolerans]